ncbi:MAG: L-threonylcarbamoyladenylate synthase [Paracoccaceae bacterium]
MNISKMKNTEILSNDDFGVERASKIIKSGGLVALPTETVYGLGADATNPKAIDLIYRTKGRPSINPLIIHVYENKDVFEIADKNEISQDLSSKFWPGPLTLILNKKNNTKLKLAKNALAGLSTLAVRVPAHPVFRNLLKKCKLPIACPSANFSGKLTSTRFEDVLSSFSGKIDAIIDGGPCPIGVESTIIKIENQNLSILRPGKITEEDLLQNNYSLQKNKNNENIIAPGQLRSHYRPNTSLRLNVKNPKKNELLLSFGPLPKGVTGISLSEVFDLNEAAMNLYSSLADLDELALINQNKSIAINTIPNIGIGIAINDRLRRASS